MPDLLGTHDFTSFCASGSSVEDKVRTIHEASVHVNETGDELTFTFRGDGFLRKMIRFLVGTLLKIGNGRLEPTAIPAIIAAKDRNLAGPTAHPEGLYLAEVNRKLKRRRPYKKRSASFLQNLDVFNSCSVSHDRLHVCANCARIKTHHHNGICT